MPLNGYLIYHLTEGKIFREGLHNVQFSSYNISPDRALFYNNYFFNCTLLGFKYILLFVCSWEMKRSLPFLACMCGTGFDTIVHQDRCGYYLLAAAALLLSSLQHRIATTTVSCGEGLQALWHSTGFIYFETARSPQDIKSIRVYVHVYSLHHSWAPHPQLYMQSATH